MAMELDDLKEGYCVNATLAQRWEGDDVRTLAIGRVLWQYPIERENFKGGVGGE